MGRTTLSIEKDKILISSSLFKLNQEETNTRAALHCKESTNPVLVKVKDTDTNILILMVYPFALISPPYDWYLQIDYGKIVSVNIIYQNFGKTTSLYLPQFHSLTVCDTVSHFFGISKTSVFQRLLKNTSAAHPTEKLGESATVSENYQVMSLIQKYIYREKTNKDLVEKRMRQYNTMKTKITQTILLNPYS